MLTGTNIGTITDADGAFSLLVNGKDPVLRVSYIGMKEQHIHINSQKGNFFLIRMESDVEIMDEVLVTGYQNLKRENATGSYQMITSKDMENRYSGTIVGNLEGKIPGLVSYNTGLNDKGEASLLIRGAGSFQAKTSPLVVVDGLPIEGSIESVNPYDIENVTILRMLRPPLSMEHAPPTVSSSLRPNVRRMTNWMLISAAILPSAKSKITAITNGRMLPK